MARVFLVGLGMACAIATAGVARGQDGPVPLGEALRSAMRPALPFPDAGRDGTAPDASPVPVWTVRWPEPGALVIEVVANPLNPGNTARALQAEQAIQKSAMSAQERSQSDYERALRDFQRTGRVGEIREVSLNDEGLAGERYDAESQLTIEAIEVTGDHRIEVATAKAPAAFPAVDGPTAIVRLSANEYVSRGDGADAVTRFCAEQAWVVFGGRMPSVEWRADASRAIVTTGREPPGGAGKVVIVALRGNVELVDRVLQTASWAPLKAYIDQH
jgi:hypothetical protein